jgi:hypothetical protein
VTSGEPGSESSSAMMPQLRNRSFELRHGNGVPLGSSKRKAGSGSSGPVLREADSR